MNSQEEILDQAISRVKKTEAALDLSELKNAPAILSIIASLSALPKSEIPAPAKQRKYAAAPSHTGWLAWLTTTRLATAGSLAVVLMLLAGTGYAASQSSPGGPLFAVKKTYEHLQVQLARDQITKANLQVAIAQQRLADAQVILNNPGSTAPQQKAALTELSSETQNTVNALTAAAKNNALSQKNHPVLASLEKLTKEQQTLLQEIKTPANLTQDKQTALDATKTSASQVQEIKKYIATASQEQGLIKLESNPDAVAITGRLGDRIFDNKISVEKTEFFIDSKTQIQDSSGNDLDFKALAGKQRVSVLGIKSNYYLLAKQITILDDSQDQAKASPAGKNPPDQQKTASSTAAGQLKKTDVSPQKPNPDQSPEKQNDSNTATGSVIFESPLPPATDSP